MQTNERVPSWWHKQYDQKVTGEARERREEMTFIIAGQCKGCGKCVRGEQIAKFCSAHYIIIAYLFAEL